MVHRYKLNNFNIVLDVCSGSIHAVDALTYDMIGLYEGTDRAAVIAAARAQYPDVDENELNEVYDQLTALKDAGKLFAPDTFAPMAGKLKEKSAGVVKALCLHVAHTCNLNCAYCFASQGRFHGERALMSFEVGKQAMDSKVSGAKRRPCSFRAVTWSQHSDRSASDQPNRA